MPNKKIPKKDAKLKAFIKAGGRKDVEADFNELLKRATKSKKDSKSDDKAK